MQFKKRLSLSDFKLDNNLMVEKKAKVVKTASIIMQKEIKLTYEHSVERKHNNSNHNHNHHHNNNQPYNEEGTINGFLLMDLSSYVVLLLAFSVTKNSQRTLEQ